MYSKNTSYLLCVCKEQGSFSLCEQDFKQDYMYYAPEGCPRGTHTDRTAYTRLYQDDWSLAHYNPHLFPRCAAYKARYARAPLRDAKQGCPHRPQGAKRACPVQKSAPRLTISRRTRSPRTGGGGAPLGLHCDTSSRGHLSCYETPGDPHLGHCPHMCSPRCSPRWGFIYVCVSHSARPRFVRGPFSVAAARQLSHSGLAESPFFFMQALWNQRRHTLHCHTAVLDWDVQHA